MSANIIAEFQDVNTADLALRDLESMGIPILNRKTHAMLFPGADQRVTNLVLGSANRFSPPPLQDGGTLLSMRIPTITPFAAENQIHDRLSGRVQISLTVPDNSKSRAEECLVNRGGSHIQIG